MGPFDRRCTSPPSVWLTHGRADERVPFVWGERTRDHWIAAANCAAHPVSITGTTCERYVDCATGTDVVFCPHDGDHGPPPFAAREIWSFFSAQR
jgi:hypothetical protein